MTTKVCTKCGVEKDVGEFPPRKSVPCGIYPKCKRCASEKNRARYVAQKERLLALLAKRRENDREKVRQIARESRARRLAREPDAGKKACERQRLLVSDGYVRQLLTNHGTNLRSDDIPQPLINLKREQLRLMRELKKAKS
jgi:ssDNA-binding Zn-finger/Zn-ribbon topoisomerase 1